MRQSCTQYINTCKKLQLLLGEGSSAFFEGKFEPFSRYLAMGDTWRSATPSSCSPTPTLSTLPRAASAVLKPCLTGVFFLDFMPHHRLAIHVFFTVPCGTTTSLDLAIHNCIYRMRASGACRDFSREAVNIFSRFVRHRARWLGWHRAGPRAVNVRAVDAATFTNNVVIESMLFFFLYDLFRYYIYLSLIHI